MDIFRATREAESNLEILIDGLKVIQKDGFISKHKTRDKRILESVINRLTIQKETLHRFKYAEEDYNNAAS